jgi:phage N-6-adenine-methyltransferase
LSQISFHPLADIFPMLGEAELAELSADIRANGPRDPIMLAPDMSILDGRNRYLACLKADAQPIFDNWERDESEMLAFVISKNLQRRHLDDGQRAGIAAKLATMKQGSRTDLPSIGGRCVSQAEAAELLNVSVKSVERAAKVRAQGIPELVHAVECGLVSVSAAADVATLPRAEQTEIVAAGPASVRDAAKDIRSGGFLANASFAGNNEWFTPDEHIALARAVLGTIDLDPASHATAQERIHAAEFFSQEQNGLAQEWRGRVWLNPPYSQPEIEQFVDKLISEITARRVTEAIMLTNNSTDTSWFQKAARSASSICFTRGRVRFVSPESGVRGMPAQGQAFFYFGPNKELFGSVFSAKGLVYGASMKIVREERTADDLASEPPIPVTPIGGRLAA